MASIEDPNYCSKTDCRLREAIWKAHKKFLEKIGASAKNNAQVINKLVAEILRKSNKLATFTPVAQEYFVLLLNTIEAIGPFPSKLKSNMKITFSSILYS
jgi:hypothetical protein